MLYTKTEQPLQHYFCGLTEQTFIADLGVADPPLIDYLSGLLSRFVRLDAIFRLRSSTGRRLEEVADMIMEAESLPPEGRTSREMHRHIGDFTLFWTGVYPEMLRKLRSVQHKDHFIDYQQQGKRSYYIASTLDDEAHHEDSGILRRISERFELCAYGLTQVRKEWERLPGRA